MIPADDKRVTRVMTDTGMDRTQAWRHVNDAAEILRRDTIERRAAALRCADAWARRQAEDRS